MLQTCNPMQEFLLQPCGTSSEEWIARGTALTPEFCQTKLREFRRAAQIPGVAFEVDGKLLAGVDPVLGIGNNLLPDFSGAFVFAPAFRHQRELALMAKRRGEHERAAEIWQEIVADPQDGIYACEQLAIHFERHARNLSRAAEFAQLGLAKLRCQRSASRDPFLAARSTWLEQKFLHRIARLQHQMPTATAWQGRLLFH